VTFERGKESFRETLLEGDRMRIRPFTLAFPPSVERAFQDHYFNKFLSQVRFSLGLAVFFYAAFGVLDAFLVPEIRRELWLIRYAVFCPFTLGVLLFSFSPYFRKYMQGAMSAVVALGGVGIIAMIVMAPPPANYSYYAGLILVLIFGYTFMRIRFVWATLTGWLIVALYQVVAIRITDTPLPVLLNNDFFFIGANLVGMLACHSIEYHARRDFLLARLLEEEQRKVKDANHFLEDRVEERTRQLALANEELVQEIAERKRAEEQNRLLEIQLRQAQKMEAIGTLAGGIAHDFNNILSPIFGYTQMALGALPPDSPLRKHLSQVLKAASRARSLVQQILTFSRQSEQDRGVLELKPVVEEALKLLGASLPKNIEIRADLDRCRGEVLADATQMHQVVMNLCTNAYQAMKKGGVLEVSLWDRVLGEEDALPLHLRSGTYVVLAVSDTGCGMNREVLERIYDPFFTTKPPGEGTGMGLAAVHGIVRSHHGRISATSQPGEGSRFEIYLPRASLPMESSCTVSASSLEKVAGSGEHVLFAGDEATMATMVSGMLEKLGYRVTAVNDGSEALEMFNRSSNDFHLVLADQSISRMTGLELAREVLALRPAMPVVLCTGYSDALTREKAMELGVRATIGKPVVLDQVGLAVRLALDQS